MTTYDQLRAEIDRLKAELEAARLLIRKLEFSQRIARNDRRAA